MKEKTISSKTILQLLDDAPDLAVIGFDQNLKICHYGEGARRLMGWSSVEAVGQPGDTLLHEENFLAATTAKAGKTTVAGDTRVIRSGGDLLHARVLLRRAAASEAPIAWWGLYQDMSEIYDLRERIVHASGPFASSSLHEAREAQFLSELLRHTMENIRIGIAVLEANEGRITYVNDGFEQITGFTVLDASTRTVGELLEGYPIFRTHLEGFLDEVVEGGAVEAEVRHWEVDVPAGTRILETYARLIAIEGFPQQFVLLLIEDNTMRQRLQLQLVQSEKLAAIGQLAAGIAHEIRNPLNTIYNALYDLDEIIVERTAEISEDIEISMEEIRRVQDIINNLLDFARETERPRASANLSDVVRKTVRLVQHDMTNKSIDIELDLEAEGEVSLSTNALKQILINLFTNAAQAMAGGGKLTIRTREISKGSPRPKSDFEEIKSSRYRVVDKKGEKSSRRPVGERVLLQVIDTGAGIPSNILPNVFNPFFTTKEPGSGTGLGLSVVHSLVRDAGGSIGVESAENHGTTFTFELPLADQ